MTSMPSGARELVAAYRRERWKSEPYDAFLALGADELPELVFACLEELEDAPTFFDDALSLIDEAVFAVAIARAIPAVCDDDGPAVAVINYASLQVPQLLAPHLPALWEPAGRSDFLAARPWRGADAPERERLLVELERAERRRLYPDERVGGQRAALALLESRHEPTIARVLASPWASAQKSAAIELHAHAVGFDPDRHPTWRTGASVGSRPASAGAAAARFTACSRFRLSRPDSVFRLPPCTSRPA
jgi:hypothetical protein